MKITNKQLKQIIKEELEQSLNEDGLDPGIGRGSFTKDNPLTRIQTAQRELMLAIRDMESEGDAFAKTDSGPASFEVLAAAKKALEILEQAASTEFLKHF